MYDRIQQTNKTLTVMIISVKNITEATFHCDALILPILEDQGIRPYADIDKAVNGLLGRIISSKEFSARHNEISLVHTQGKIKPDRILLIGLGKRKDVSSERLRQAGGKAASYMHGLNINSAGLSVKTIEALKLSPAVFLEGALLNNYRFENIKKMKTIREQKVSLYFQEKIWLRKSGVSRLFARQIILHEIWSTPPQTT